MSETGGPHTLPFRYDRADFLALAKLGRPRIVGWLFKLAWVLFALAALLIALCMLNGSTRVLPYAFALLALLVVYLLLHRFGYDISAWALDRMARRSDILREQTFTVAADCFRAESSRGKTEVRWSAVPRIVEDDTRVFVYSTRHQAFIVPERAFATRADFDAFAAAAKHHWERHHRL
ncbi:YcxB family protein [Sphingomonas sp. SM33]|uniref:YcxB family protein n=1 Tax=Sphingomonas telluris TaxID=2907998 RepID=A0ABS9VJ23_9SPHN|nr:YcxB family protein [Sphingomonas telluris]